MNADDAFHIKARTLFNALLTNGAELITTNYVVVETIAVLQSRYGMEPVYDFLDGIMPTLQVVWISQSDHQAAEQLLRAVNRRRVSLVDCVSFVIMNKHGINQVFAWDRDFEDFGFTILESVQ